MRIVFFLLLATSFCVAGVAQAKDPVKWAFTAKKVSADTYEVHLTANVDKGWHTYSQTTPEGGPVPTTITFTKNPVVTLVGQVSESGKLEQHNEPLFGVIVKQYSNKVDFVQIMKVKSGAKTVVAGSIEYMVCDNSQCLPPKTVTFSVALK